MSFAPEISLNDYNSSEVAFDDNSISSQSSEVYIVSSYSILLLN